MSSVEEYNSPSSNYEKLFSKIPSKVVWDEKSPERTSVLSISQDNIDQSLSSQDFEKESEDENTKSTNNFLPSMVRFEPRAISFEVASPSTSVNTDSLERTKTSETGDGEEQCEIEEDSLEESEITDEELDLEENCEKEDSNPVDYLDKEVFPVLLPCLEKMLFAAKENDVLKVQKSRFNGLDYLAELLWNCNPLHPERQGTYVPLFDIPFVQKHLEEHPRPIIPQSWLWTRDQAAVVLQAAARGYLVRCQPQVQEMRQFWKELAVEKQRTKGRISEANCFGPRSTTLDTSSSVYNRYQDGYKC